MRSESENAHPTISFQLQEAVLLGQPLEFLELVGF
jgi:hypothetical protein